ARPLSPNWLIGMMRWMSEFSLAILFEQPDFIRWYFGTNALPLNLEVRLVRDIPRLVEWQGSDIRNPELECAEIPYYKYAFAHGYEHRESAAISHQRQALFAEAGFACVAPVGMLQYIERDLFPEVHVVSQRLVLD